jgi:N-acylneuraminate cytidylyltransferase
MDGMVTGRGVLAVIPARGGSRSIPRKNVRLLGGHPLVAYSIAAAKQAASLSRIIVSTDDPEVAEIARAYGADVPFMRPAELATDLSTDFHVFEHLLQQL